MDQVEKKKGLEEAALHWIQRAYQDVTSETFIGVTPSETPDFLASDLAGQTVGIEITRLKFPPEDMWARQVMSRDQFADDGVAMMRVLQLLHTKTLKLRSGGWPTCQRKILFIQMEDSTLERLGPFDVDLPDQGGFTEVWLADFTELEEQQAVFLKPLVHPLGDRFACKPQERDKPFG